MNEKTTGKANEKRKPSLVGLIILLILAIPIGFCVNQCFPPSGSEKSFETGPDEIETFVMSQSFVKKFLKSPSTAEFPQLIKSVTTVSHNGIEWTVNSYVDVQNSFGAMIRSQYTCVLEYSGEDKWTLKKLIFDGEQLYP